MKLLKFKKVFLLLFLCIVTTIISISVFTDEEVLLEDFIIEDDDIYIVLGETDVIEVTTVPSNATVAGQFTFGSSDLSVASIGLADGVITGCTPGKSIITVTYVDERRDLVISKNINVHVVFRSSEAALPYEPDKWNASNIIQKRNCYSYAFNLFDPVDAITLPDDYTYRPGNISSQVGPCSLSDLQSSKALVADSFLSKVIADIVFLGVDTKENALIEVGLNDVIPSDRYKVVLFIQYNENSSNMEGWGNFHWYRQNDDGTWSQKDDTTPVTNLDESGEVIYNPLTCTKNISNYEYVGCYAVKSWN